jgi:mono/diheme cytochrome c family protein
MKRLAFLVLSAALAGACNRAEAPRQTAAPAPPDAKIAAGRAAITQYGCNVCHVIPGIEGGGALGPSLEGIASRPTISNGVVQNTPAHLAQYVQDPGSLNPQASMPPIGVTDAESDAIAAYLMTLK